MSFTSVLGPFAVALTVCAAIAGAAAAEDAAPASGAPAAEPANPLPGTPSGATPNPVPDAGTTGQASCIDETGDYETHGKIITFVIGLQNKCEKRLKCEVFANVTGAKGSSLGHTTMILGAKSSGAAAKKSYAMKVKAAGGTAEVSRECREF